jgi:hypothetical protein
VIACPATFPRSAASPDCADGKRSQREDVLAYVEDGVLTIKIPVAPPAVHEEELDIQVR